MPRTRTSLAILATLFAFAAQAQIIWGTKAKAGQPPAYSQTPTLLLRYDPFNNTVATIDSIQRNGVDIDVDALACLPSLGLIAWEVTSNGAQMVTIDSTSGAAQNFGPFLAGSHIRGACFDQAANILALDFMSNELLRIRPSDGTIASSVPLTMNGASHDLPAGCDIAWVGSAFYIHEIYQLYQVDTLSGEMNFVFEDNVVDSTDTGVCLYQYAPNVGGIAATPSIDLHSYVALDGNCEDDLYRYLVFAPQPRVELIHNVTPGFNSGGHDLATAVPNISTGLAPAELEHGSLTLMYMTGSGLSLSTSKGGLGEVLVFDALGRIVVKQWAGGSMAIHIPMDLRQGLYFVTTAGGHDRFFVR